MTSDNSIEEEIQHRITLGNEAYYANQFFFKIRLVSKKSKLKLYWSNKGQIITYASETWVLKWAVKTVNCISNESVKKDFCSYKRRDGTWRIKTNVELDELIRHKNITNHTKALVRPFTTNAGRENVKKLYKWKPMLTRPLGRPKNRWENDIRNDMKKLKIKNWNSGI